MPCASTCAASASPTAPPAGALDPVGRRARHARPPRRHVVPPRGVLVRRRGGRRGRPEPGRMPCARCCSPRPVAACSPSARRPSPPSPPRRTRPWRAATSTPPSRPNVDGLGRGGGADARRRRPGGHGIRAGDAAPGLRHRRGLGRPLDLDEVELDPPAVERYAEVAQPVLLVVGGHDLDTVQPGRGRPRGRPAAGAPGRPPRRRPPAVDGGAGGASSGSSSTGSPSRTEATRSAQAAGGAGTAGCGRHRGARGAAPQPDQQRARAPGPRRRRTGAPRRRRSAAR